MARIVVLGGTGFVGHHLLPALHAAGHDLVVLTRNRARHRDLGVLPRLRLVDADPYAPAVLERHLAGADVAINLVGILNERGDKGDGFHKAHVALTQALVDACRAAGVPRLLQMSALRAGEGTSHYSRTRAEAEAIVRGSGLAWTILRPSVIFGPGDGLYFRFAGLLRFAPVLPLACADTKFAPVWVGDVVRAYLRCVSDAGTIGRVYELGGPRVVTLRQIVRDAARWNGLRRYVLPLPGPLAALQARVAEWLPGKPFSRDNLRSLALDSVPKDDGLAALDITPRAPEDVMPALFGVPARVRNRERVRR